MTTNEEIKAWVSLKTDNYTSVLAKSCLTMDGSEDDHIKESLNWGSNGLGDRFGRSMFNYTVIHKNGRTTRYSQDIDDTIDDNILQTFVNESKNARSGIIGLFIHSLKGKSTSRTIRDDIGIEIRKRSCVVCGSKSAVVCDHKNDLYNDDRVLSENTQNIDDFQALCNHCNLQKRQVCKDERKNRVLFSAKSIPQFSRLKFDFTWEKKEFDLTDINCKVGTYWYDPLAFMDRIQEMIENKN
jgi:5-methylcytosine-specific restriction endonuclease McrA